MCSTLIWSKIVHLQVFFIMGHCQTYSKCIMFIMLYRECALGTLDRQIYTISNFAVRCLICWVAFALIYFLGRRHLIDPYCTGEKSNDASNVLFMGTQTECSLSLIGVYVFVASSTKESLALSNFLRSIPLRNGILHVSSV